MSAHQFSTTCCLGKPISAVRYVIWIARGNSIIIGGNASARSTAKPRTMKSFHLVPPEYYLTATEMENFANENTFFRHFDDNHYIIHTHHAWPSQMHLNLLISGVKTLTIARVLTANQQICLHLWRPIVIGPYNKEYTFLKLLMCIIM